MCWHFLLNFDRGEFFFGPIEPMDWSKFNILSTLEMVLFLDHFHAGGWPCLGKSWAFHRSGDLQILDYCREKFNTWIQMKTKQVFFRWKFYIREKERGQGAGTVEKKKQKVWVQVNIGSTHGGQLVLGILWVSKWEGGCL